MKGGQTEASSSPSDGYNILKSERVIVSLSLTDLKSSDLERSTKAVHDWHPEVASFVIVGEMIKCDGY